MGLQVTSVGVRSVAAQFARAGDIVVAINGVPVAPTHLAKELIDKVKASGDVQTLLLHRLPGAVEDAAQEEKKVGVGVARTCVLQPIGGYQHAAKHHVFVHLRYSC